MPKEQSETPAWRGCRRPYSTATMPVVYITGDTRAVDSPIATLLNQSTTFVMDKPRWRRS